MSDTPRTDAAREWPIGLPPTQHQRANRYLRLCYDLERELATVTAERDAAFEQLQFSGFVRCDIPACNCGRWHHRFGLPERWQEIKDDLEAAGHPLCNENGHLVRKALAALVAEWDAALKDAERLKAGIDAVAALMDESYGVAGLHLNGDVAPWSELRTGGRFEEWLLAFDAAIKEKTDAH